jgi:cell wall-associated NlpC family hydrolase
LAPAEPKGDPLGRNAAAAAAANAKAVKKNAKRALAKQRKAEVAFLTRNVLCCLSVCALLNRLAPATEAKGDPLGRNAVAAAAANAKAALTLPLLSCAA